MQTLLTLIAVAVLLSRHSRRQVPDFEACEFKDWSASLLHISGVDPINH
jgi:hypothetical protein